LAWILDPYASAGGGVVGGNTALWVNEADTYGCDANISGDFTIPTPSASAPTATRERHALHSAVLGLSLMGVIEVPIPFALGFGAGILLAILLRDASILRWVFQSLAGCVLGIVFMLVGLFLIGHFHRQFIAEFVTLLRGKYGLILIDRFHLGHVAGWGGYVVGATTDAHHQQLGQVHAPACWRLSPSSRVALLTFNWLQG
jgi:hypothetical protein